MRTDKSPYATNEHEWCDRCDAPMRLIEIDYRFNEDTHELVAFTQWGCEHKLVSSGHLVENIPSECEVEE